MLKRALGAIALLCLAGCVTAPADMTTVNTWAGQDVNDILPPLELVAIGNREFAAGNVTIQTVPYSVLVRVCRHDFNGIIQGCTVPRGSSYTVYIDEQYPYWLRELLGTHELGHVGQFELGLPLDHAGFHDPSVDLIHRVGG